MLHRLLFLSLLPLLAGIIPATAQLWEYGEVANTPLNQVVGSSGGFWNLPISDVTTDGGGALVLRSTSAGSVRAYLPITALSTGNYEVKVVLKGWNFSGAPNLGPLLEIGLANNVTGIPTSSVAHFRLETSASNLSLSGSAGGSASSETNEPNDRFFPQVRTTPLTLKLTINFTAGTYQVSTSDDQYILKANGLLATPRRVANFIFIRLATDFTIGGNGNLSMERMSFGPVQTQSGYAAWKTLYFTPEELTNPVVSGDAADPNYDGVPNLVQFAAGQSPRAPGGSAPLQASFNENSPTFTFRRPRDPVAAGVSSSVETSTDLTNWTPSNLSAFSIQNNSDGYETVQLSDGSSAVQNFYRLRIEPF